MTAVVRTEQLTRHYGRLKAVQGIDLEVHEGDVYGFLGLNGAGKTTTIRMLLGLIRPTRGRVQLFGLDARENFIAVMSKVGSLVELPAYYPHLTARQNLEIVRTITGGVSGALVAETLERVGLNTRADDAVRTFSQGMRQRLGIAMALLPQPKLVILDEPTNGLDPHGVNQIREIIVELNRTRGVTFLISSHLLHEVEITCNRVGIIKDGRLIVQDSVDRLLALTGGAVRIEVDRREEALSVLQSLNWATRVDDSADGALLVKVDPTRQAELNAALVGKGLRVSAFVPQRMTLEEYFLSR